MENLGPLSINFEIYLDDTGYTPSFQDNIYFKSHQEEAIIKHINKIWNYESLRTNEDNLRLSFTGAMAEEMMFENRDSLSYLEVSTKLLTVVTSELIKLVNRDKDSLEFEDYLGIATIGLRQFSVFDLENKDYPDDYSYDNQWPDFSNSFNNLPWSNNYEFTKSQIIYFFLTAFEEETNVKIFS